ncbi:hypothetical protein [Burkholderia guangdongensis]|nr:hypothetical protein [Burkholderia guangdongensis]
MPKAIEADAGEPLADLREALEEGKVSDGGGGGNRNNGGMSSES